MLIRAIPAVLIAILVICNSGAESKRRSTQQQIQVPSADPTQPSAPDQRGTDQVPFTIKVIPSETAKEKADREERERRVEDEKAAIDKRLADETKRLADETGNLANYARWLDGITVLLFIAAVGQIGLFVWQLRLINASLKEAKAATKAATVGAKAAQDSADSYMNAERPYIFISSTQPVFRDVHFPGTVGARLVTSMVSLKVTIKNYGRTPAIIENISSELRLSEDVIPANSLIIPGQFLIIERNGEYPFDAQIAYDESNGETAKMLQIGQIGFWLHFSFVYRDIFDKSHETAGRWSYDLGSKRWSGQYGKAT